MNDFSARLIKAMKEKQLKQSDLAKLSGISHSRINCYIHNRYTAKQSTIHILAETLGVSEGWLMGYDVPMSRKSPAFDEVTPTVSTDLEAYPVIGKRLRAIRKSMGMTLDELAQKYNEEFDGKISKGTLSKYENGKQIPMSTVIQNLAQLMQISADYLLGSTNVVYNTTRMIPIYDTISAGFDIDAANHKVDQIPLIINEGSEADNTFCVRVTGDSMYPKIECNDIIQIHKQSHVDNRKIGIFLINGMNYVIREALYSEDKNWLVLHPLNPEYAPKCFAVADTQRIKILGLVKKVIKNL